MDSPRSIADSPWFWAYLFSTAGLIGLALIGPKYGSRQAQLERQYEGRQVAAYGASDASAAADSGSPHAAAAPGRTLVSLRPLWLVLAAATIVAWIVFWRNHVARQRGVSAAIGTPP